jgi:hypothetical protein
LLTFSFAGALAKILSAGQKETEMAGFLNGIKLFIPKKYRCKQGVLCVFAWRFHQLASPLLSGGG